MQIQILIDGKDARVALPVKWNTLLDERLDESRLSLRNEQTKLYRIGAPVSIRVNNTQKDFIISADESKEIPAGSGRYDHELSLIEPTKILEGIIVESLTFTNNLGRTYMNTPVEALRENLSNSSGILPHSTNYRTPMRQGSILHVSSYTETFDENDLPLIPIGMENAPDPTITVINPLNAIIETRTITTREELSTISFDVLLSIPGLYQVIYQFESPAAKPVKCKFGFTILSALTYNELPKWNIRTVIERVLDVAEPHIQNVKPRFHLDENQVNEFENILAPEFAFTKCTLKEILDQIGGFIHGIPQLILSERGEFDTIRYDMLGGTKKAALSDPRYKYIAETRSQNIEDYATQLDSTVENFVNTIDSGEGAITEPWVGGWKSVRSEEAYARITDGNMVIETKYPIYSVQKLMVINDGHAADITGYLFEGADYGRLSSYDNIYPTSKAYAIYYEVGKKNIRGLSFKTKSIWDSAVVPYAIANIVKAATGTSISGSTWNTDPKVGKYPNLTFQITYTPIFTSRVLQQKPTIDPDAFKRTLSYGQAANLVETRYYGENLKGAIARMGNPEVSRTYCLADLTLVPNKGELWELEGDEYYVSDTSVAVYAGAVYCVVGLSKDFNRLSQYVGINSEWRAYEVSERKAYDRDIAYADLAVIGDPIESDGNALITAKGIGDVAYSFVPSFAERKQVNIAAVTGYVNDKPQSVVSLPVISAAFGNSLSFSFGMEDNYSAGAQSVYGDNGGDIKGYWQTDVPYGDYYGRLDTVDFKLSISGDTSYEIRDNKGTPTELPNGDFVMSDVPASIETASKLVVRKDGRETLRFNYSIQFVSTWKNLIIGSGLTKNNVLVTAKYLNGCTLYVMREKIGRFDTHIDKSGASDIFRYTQRLGNINGITIRPAYNQIEFAPLVSSVSGDAWAIVDTKTGEIFMARNEPVRAGAAINLPTITFTHEYKKQRS